MCLQSAACQVLACRYNPQCLAVLLCHARDQADEGSSIRLAWHPAEVQDVCVPSQRLTTIIYMQYCYTTFSPLRTVAGLPQPLHKPKHSNGLRVVC